MLLTILGWTGLISSLLYQGIALPQAIWRSWRFKQSPPMSTLMLALSTAAYTSTTLRAALQPDWFDFGSRCLGALSSVVVAGQAYFYRTMSLNGWLRARAATLWERWSTCEVVHVSAAPPYTVRRLRVAVGIHKPKGHYCWLRRGNEPWRRVSTRRYKRIYAQLFFLTPEENAAPYFHTSCGVSGAIWPGVPPDTLGEALRLRQR